MDIPPPPYSLDSSPPHYTTIARANSASSTTSTHAIPFSAGVAFTRAFPEIFDDEIIIVTVRIRLKPQPEQHNSSIDSACSDASTLPPPPMSSSRRGRLLRSLQSICPSSDHTGETGRQQKKMKKQKKTMVKALKMPRSQYRRYFARDMHGNFIGTEAEREWDEEELEREFGGFQSLPIASRYCTEHAPYG